jgi:hypothetical protein
MMQIDFFAPGESRSPAALTQAETIVYQMVYEAAEQGQPCPLNLDLEDAAGYESTSMGAKTIARLEAKGYLVVERSQKARRAQVTATGKWTAWPEWHRSGAPRVDRGSHDPTALLRALSVEVDGLDVDTLSGLNALERLLDRARELVARRKIGVLTRG